MFNNPSDLKIFMLYNAYFLDVPLPDTSYLYVSPPDVSPLDISFLDISALETLTKVKYTSENLQKITKPCIDLFFYTQIICLELQTYQKDSAQNYIFELVFWEVTYRLLLFLLVL